MLHLSHNWHERWSIRSHIHRTLDFCPLQVPHSTGSGSTAVALSAKQGQQPQTGQPAIDGIMAPFMGGPCPAQGPPFPMAVGPPARIETPAYRRRCPKMLDGPVALGNMCKMWFFLKLRWPFSGSQFSDKPKSTSSAEKRCRSQPAPRPPVPAFTSSLACQPTFQLQNQLQEENVPGLYANS